MKYILLIWSIILTIIAGILFSKINSKDNKVINTENSSKLVSQIDSLILVCDSLKQDRVKLLDSIKSIDTRIVTINKTYEKDYNTILTQPTDSDCVYFAKYLEISKNSK